MNKATEEDLYVLELRNVCESLRKICKKLGDKLDVAEAVNKQYSELILELQDQVAHYSKDARDLRQKLFMALLDNEELKYLLNDKE